METFIDVINRWPTVVSFASDTGTDVKTAYKWRKRNSIPSAAWLSVIAAAKKRKFTDVTVDRLARIAQGIPTNGSTTSNGS